MSRSKLIEQLEEIAAPISSAFIVQAVNSYADEVLENKEQILEQEKRSIVAPELWIEIAEKVKAITKEFNEQS